MNRRDKRGAMLKGGGTDVATCYANRSPVEKSREAKATPSNGRWTLAGEKQVGLKEVREGEARAKRKTSPQHRLLLYAPQTLV